MSDEPTQWDLLNAYADGELDAASRAAVEAEIAAHPRLGDELREIMEMKRALASMRPAPTEEGRPALARRTGVAGGAIAACLVVAVLAAYALLPARDQWVDLVLERHHTLSQATYVVDEARTYPVISSRLSASVRAPDLTASRLFLVDVATSASAAGEMIAMHYRGLSGCRLSVVASVAPAGAALPEAPGGGGLLFRDALLDGYWVAVVAEGMDRQRFASIADTVEATLVHESEDGERYRSAMAEIYRRSQPCA
jgi:anti-sigma factor RsiW